MSTIGVSDQPDPNVLGALATLAAYFARIVRDAIPGNAANDTSERYYDARCLCSAHCTPRGMKAGS
jgi:hypothetical protein